MKKLTVVVGLLLTAASMGGAHAAHLNVDTGAGETEEIASTWGSDATKVKNDLLNDRFLQSSSEFKGVGISVYADEESKPHPFHTDVRYVGVKFTVGFKKWPSRKKRHRDYYFLINRAPGASVNVSIVKPRVNTYRLRANKVPGKGRFAVTKKSINLIRTSKDY